MDRNAPAADAAEDDGTPATVRERLGGRAIVLVGMMGCGKSSVGRRLAARLDLPFVDADQEIEKAAGQTISDIFATYGEAEFRAGERRVIHRLLSETRGVIATGGGAFIDPDTRGEIAEGGVSIWLKVAPDILFRRVKRRNTRPLLKTADPEKTLRGLLDAREPVYALADLTVESDDGPHEAVVQAIVDALAVHLDPARQTGPARQGETTR